MSYLRNVLAIIGALTVVGLILAVPSLARLKARIDVFDERALGIYERFAVRLLQTGNPASATVWRSKVTPGLSFEDVEDSIEAAAVEHNIGNVGELSLSRTVEARSGKPWRRVKIYMFCDPVVAARMLDFDDAYAAYMSCRVALVEDKTGQLWIYTLDLDMLIHGGTPLPAALRKDALRIRDIIRSILDWGTSGEF